MAEPDPDQPTSPSLSSADSGVASSPATAPGPVESFDDELYGQELEDVEEEGEAGPAEATEWFDEQGRRHVRRAAPEGTEELLEKDVPRETGLSDRMERWRTRSAVGAVATAFALGLQSAFEAPKDDPAIIMETSGEPPTDLPVEAQLEQLGPRQSSVKVRTWLLTGNEPAPGDPVPGGAGSRGTASEATMPDGTMPDGTMPDGTASGGTADNGGDSQAGTQ